MDTVRLGGSEWTCDPFGAEIFDDRIYGRGTSDMKGGVAALVVAAARIAEWGRGRAGLELILTAGEETGCEGSRALTRGSVLSGVGALLVAEPTANYPCLAHKGTAWLELSVTGVSAHASMPQLGENAINALCRAILALERWDPGKSHPLLGCSTVSVGVVAGGNGVNLVPDWACAAVDMRTVPGEDPATILERMRTLLGPTVGLETRLLLPSVATELGNPWVQEVFDVMEPLIGSRPQPRGLAYFTDAAVLAPASGGPPTIICGPGDPELAHQTDESCSISRLESAAEGFTEIARRWCGL